MNEKDMNDALREMDCSDDFGTFFFFNPPVNRNVYIREIWNTHLYYVDFSGSRLHGILWDVDMYRCDFSDADLSNLKIRDYITYFQCRVTQNTIPPTILGQPVSAFVKTIERLKSENTFRNIMSKIMPYDLTLGVFQYWAFDLVTAGSYT